MKIQTKDKEKEIIEEVISNDYDISKMFHKFFCKYS